jgi:hypothetical protein
MAEDAAVRTGSPELRRAFLAVGLFLAWTAFVWLGRVRNAFGDPALSAQERTGPLLLAASFVLPTLAVLVALSGSVRGRRLLDPWASILLRVLAGWTTVLWVVRAADIVFAGDHEVGFVVVHVVLAVVSIGLAGWAVAADRRARSGSHRTPLTTSHQHMA